MSRRAFTLVELLVVIAIIGLLSTVAVISFSGSRAKSRNAKRLADIRQLINAFNLGYANSGSYPDSTINRWACLSSQPCTWGGAVQQPNVTTFLAPYISTLPTDPPDGGIRGRSGYLYDGAFPGDALVPAGPTLNYSMELSSSFDCIGILTYTTSNEYECKFPLNQ